VREILEEIEEEDDSVDCEECRGGNFLRKDNSVNSEECRGGKFTEKTIA
jgi:hypothetical protein